MGYLSASSNQAWTGVSSRSPGFRESARPRRFWREMRGADQRRDGGDEEGEGAVGVSLGEAVEGKDFRSL